MWVCRKGCVFSWGSDFIWSSGGNVVSGSGTLSMWGFGEGCKVVGCVC